jgi:hypothetical protein
MQTLAIVAARDAFVAVESLIRSKVIDEAAGVAEQYPSLESADIPIIRGIAHAIRQLGERGRG